MENAVGIEFSPDNDSQSRLVGVSDGATTKAAKRLSIVSWYRILRVHYHWPLFQAIRFALWMAR